MSCGLEIGNYINFNYENGGETISQKAVIVDKYLLENEIPRISVGCMVGSHPIKEAYILETVSLQRYIVLKDDLIDYEVISKTVYQKPNYLALKLGIRTKIYDEVYGTEKIDDNLIGVIGEIIMIYTDQKGMKIALILPEHKSNKIEVPLVNCIAL